MWGFSISHGVSVLLLSLAELFQHIGVILADLYIDGVEDSVVDIPEVGIRVWVIEVLQSGFLPLFLLGLHLLQKGFPQVLLVFLAL